MAAVYSVVAVGDRCQGHSPCGGGGGPWRPHDHWCVTDIVVSIV